MKNLLYLFRIKLQMKQSTLLVAVSIFISLAFLNIASAQQGSVGNNMGEIHGNFQTDLQYYTLDTSIGANVPPQKFGNNSFLNILYNKDNFTAGIRYENYLYPLLGFDTRYKGQGIPYRFATYQKDGLEVTAGNFYEQFGSGMALRTYEERSLGYDNVFDGARLRYYGVKGLTIKGLVAKQRNFFSLSDGLVRAIDGEISLNDLIASRQGKKFNLTFGSCFVSKFQDDNDPVYKLPQNVGLGGGRIKANIGSYTFSAEYVRKGQDPSAINNNIYKFGEGLIFNAAYSQKGFGITASAKRIDNMNYRSDRNANNNSLMINYLPALTRQHNYNLAATIYPYATQPNGEMAYQVDLTYSFKKGTLIGGTYGATLLVNYSQANGLKKSTTTYPDNANEGYTSDFIKLGEVYYKDFNVELSKKISKKLRTTFFYANFVYNRTVIQGIPLNTVYANVEVVEVDYKFNSSNALRVELQALQTNSDDKLKLKDLQSQNAHGSWATLLAEYTISPHYFFSIIDQYNYGNPLDYKKKHYLIGSIGYTYHANRFAISYGKQRAGIFCVGGVCRQVPASNGLQISVSSSF